MYSFQLTDQFLTKDETELFDQCLDYYELDSNVWDIFSSLFKSGVKDTQPLLLKAFNDNSLCGAAIIIKCKRYGKSLFKSKFLSGIVNFVNIPFYLWIKFGCCMDMMSNPGFVRDPQQSEAVFGAMLAYMKKHYLLTIVNDYTDHRQLHGAASELPALPHALIDCSTMESINDYTKNFKNIKRKLKVFRKKKGAYQCIQGKLNPPQISALKKCFLSTAEKSIFYLPYQKLYLSAAVHTSSTHLKNVYYFIATLNDQFIGYQAAVASGKHLNALHGAFDRTLKSTYHAYDILFVKMTEFALENGLETIDFGAVINHTKAKMINQSRGMSYFVYSKSNFIQRIFSFFLKLTKIQGSGQMKFR